MRSLIDINTTARGRGSRPRETWADSWAPVQRKLQREPELIFNTYTTSDPYAEPIRTCFVSDIAYSGFLHIRPTEAKSCTCTEIPIPLTLVIPRNGSVERIESVVSRGRTYTAYEAWERKLG